MTVSARDSIFQALSHGSSNAQADTARIEAEAQGLLDSLDEIRPTLPHDDILSAFVERISGPKVAASVDTISSLTKLPASVESFLTAQNQIPSICLQPCTELINLDWLSAKLDTEGVLDDGVSVSLARWGIAETGSVVIHSDADSPILLNMLPAINIIAVHASKLLWNLEDYATAAKAAGENAPRNACLITGASGTTDIEGSLVTGAHGPRLLHIVVIND